MFTALDITGNTIFSKDAKKGTDYICPFCGETIRVRKGEVNRPHFAHMSKSNCPYDKDSKSEWHRHMQELFPIETLEKRFVDERTGEIHIADVFLADSNTVIEFQKSKISDAEFRSRTMFHLLHNRRIVWVFYEKSDSHPEAKYGRFIQEDDERFSIWHKHLHYQWHKCPRKALRNISSNIPNTSTLQLPYYSICVNYDDSDIVHRLVEEKRDYNEVWMSVHDIVLSGDMHIDEFFTPESEWLKNKIENINAMSRLAQLHNQASNGATWQPPRYQKRSPNKSRF